MVPNFYGIIKQSGSDYKADLLGLLFPNIFDTSNIHMEIIRPEQMIWTNNFRWELTGAGYSLKARNGSAAGEAIIGINDFDYILVPSLTSPDVLGNVYSGFWYFNGNTPTKNPGSYSGFASVQAIYLSTQYSLFKVTYDENMDPADNIHVYTSQTIDIKVPIIGIKLQV